VFDRPGKPVRRPARWRLSVQQEDRLFLLNR
jgi:hypothetical protein